jgi:uncharacterized membrane protein
MVSIKKMQALISILLLIGIFISALLVIIGGTLYLVQYGHNNWQTELLQADTYQLSVIHLWETALSFTPVGMIELGLLSLVATQILRVALLCWFYTAQRDYWFMFFTFFILLVLIYSSFLRN